MGSHTSPPGRLEIPELLELIVDHLSDDAQALRSCVYASRKLAPAAQRNLFHEIAFSHPHHERSITPSHLREILTQSPHLARHIRWISLNLNHPLTTEIAELSLSHVSHICIYTYPPTETYKTAPAAARRLIGLASVRCVGLTVAFSELNILNQLFGLCTPNLREVQFHQAWPFCGPGVADQILYHNRGTAAPRTKITRLVIYNSYHLPLWLLDADCPFDVSKVADIDIRLSTDDAGRLMLERTRLSVKRLAFSTRDLVGNNRINLADFPALTHVTVEGPIEHLRWFHLPLAKAPDDSLIRVLVLRLDMTDGDPTKPMVWETYKQWLRTLPKIDRALAALPLPALRRVEFCVCTDVESEWGGTIQDVGGEDATGSPVNASSAWFTKQLPELASRGVLVVAEASPVQENIWHTGIISSLPEVETRPPLEG
ncbi:hypothetical protein C8R43DRAFT_211433 [Mycena crocata]|nr:hypothetical protein C8R43DRAFT_211433 [Mycena crocata]